MDQEKLERYTQYATVLGAVITAASVVFGVLTYQRGAVEQRRAAALGILKDYLILAVEHPDLASRDEGQPVDARYEWFATHALFTAETLWTLVGDDRRWEGTIDGVLRRHRSYLVHGTLECEDFQPGFVKYMEDRVSDLKCAP